MRQQSYWHLFSSERMLQLLALAFLVRDQHRLAGVLFEQNRAVFERAEVAFVELHAINKRKSQPLGQKRPKFLRKVERQTRASRPVTMEKSDGRIEPNRL